VPTTKSKARWNWVNVVSVLFGVIGMIGTGYTIFGYYISARAPLPVFNVEPNRIEVVRSTGLRDTPLRVLHADGSPLAADVISTTAYLWNAGNAPIRSEQVLEPLLVHLENGTILDFRVTAVSRPATQLSVSRHARAEANTLEIDFRILEPGDGLTMQILYEGSVEAAIDISGTIEGVREIATPKSVLADTWWKLYAEGILYIVPKILLLAVGLAALVIPLVLIDYLGRLAQRSSSTLPARIGKVFAGGLAMALVLGFLIVFLFYAPIRAGRAARTEFVEGIPHGLLSDATLARRAAEAASEEEE
jgi:hypothetical protein